MKTITLVGAAIGLACLVGCSQIVGIGDLPGSGNGSSGGSSSGGGSSGGSSSGGSSGNPSAPFVGTWTVSGSTRSSCLATPSPDSGNMVVSAPSPSTISVSVSASCSIAGSVNGTVATFTPGQSCSTTSGSTVTLNTGSFSLAPGGRTGTFSLDLTDSASGCGLIETDTDTKQ